MNDEAAAFKAMLVACRQVRDDVHFILSVPAEKGTEYLQRIGGFPKPGESRWVAIAQLKSTKEDQPQELHKERTRRTSLERQPARPHNPYSRRAGILACDPLFQAFIATPQVQDKVAYAASYIRLYCKVTSRKDILPGSDAAEKFDGLLKDYTVWHEGPKHGAA